VLGLSMSGKRLSIAPSDFRVSVRMKTLPEPLLSLIAVPFVAIVALISETVRFLPSTSCSYCCRSMMTPAIWGVDMDVPERDCVPPLKAVEVIELPGAMRSVSAFLFDVDTIASVLDDHATEMVLLRHAGDVIDVVEPSFPAAAETETLLLNAASISTDKAAYDDSHDVE